MIETWYQQKNFYSAKVLIFENNIMVLSKKIHCFVFLFCPQKSES